MPAASSWPEPIERVAASFRRSGIEAVVEELGSGAATAAEAAAALGVSQAEMAQTSIALCDERPVAVIAAGNRRLSLERLRSATGARGARPARALEVRDLTGFEPDALPPLPLPSRIPLYADRLILSLKRIWISAGSPRHYLSCSPSDLIALTEAQVLDVTEPDG